MPEKRENLTNDGGWICPDCGRENGAETICPGCGFDQSANYLAYPTLMPPPDPNRMRLGAEVKRLQAKEKRQASELKRLRAAERKHQAEVRDLEAQAQQFREAQAQQRYWMEEAQRRTAQVQSLEAERRKLQIEKQALEEAVQQLQTEKRTMEDELQQERTEADRRQREQQQRLAEEKKRQAEAAERAGKQKKWLTVAAIIAVAIMMAAPLRRLVWPAVNSGAATGVGDGAAESSSPTVVYGSAAGETENTGAATGGGVLGNVGIENFETETSLDGVTAKTDITEVYFLNTLTDAPEDAADLSEAGDGSVLCWTDGTVQYIAGEGGVVGGSRCNGLFYEYENVTDIHFDGNFDTAEVTDMCLMFSGCEALTTLDVYGFDTANVTSMEAMFQGCSSLTALDVSNFNTSKVTDMEFMFSCCSSLAALDLSGFDTSKVTNMCYMFQTCSNLRSLDLSGWNTSNVTDMSRMFYCCTALTDFTAVLDTTNADTTDMYTGTSWE